MPAYPTGQSAVDSNTSTRSARHAIKARKPSGRAAFPLILLSGEEKAGKSWAAAAFTGNPRVGAAFWLDLGEGCGDEYGAVPGADFDLLEHDGTWVEIMARVEEVRDFAREELAAGRPPVVLVIDSMTAEWEMLSAWADKRARRSKTNKALLAQDPDAVINTTSNYWNDATNRHRRLMNILKTFPGLVILTALEKEVTQFDKAGNPVQNGAKELKVEAQKRLGADVRAWIRLSRSAPPTIVGLRSVHYDVTPGVTSPKRVPNFSLEWLVFDLLKCDPDNAKAAEIPVLDADQVAPGEQLTPDSAGDTAGFSDDVITQAAQLLDDAKRATTKAEFTPLWKEANAKNWADVPLADGTLLDLLRVEAKRVGKLDQAREEQNREPRSELEQLLDELQIAEQNRPAVLSGLASRSVPVVSDLGGDALAMVLDELRNLAVLGTEREPLIADAVLAGRTLLDGHVQKVA